MNFHGPVMHRDVGNNNLCIILVAARKMGGHVTWEGQL